MWFVVLAFSFSMAQSTSETPAEIKIDPSIQTCASLIDAKQKAYDELLVQQEKHLAVCPIGGWNYGIQGDSVKRVCPTSTKPSYLEAKAAYAKALELQDRIETLNATETKLSGANKIDHLGPAQDGHGG